MFTKTSSYTVVQKIGFQPEKLGEIKSLLNQPEFKTELENLMRQHKLKTIPEVIINDNVFCLEITLKTEGVTLTPCSSIIKKLESLRGEVLLN